MCDIDDIDMSDILGITESKKVEIPQYVKKPDQLPWWSGNTKMTIAIFLITVLCFLGIMTIIAIIIKELYKRFGKKR